MRRLKRHPESRSPFVKIGVLLAALTVIGLGVAAWLVFYTGVFSIERVVVEGNSQLEDGYVRAKSGIDAYKNLVTAPSGSISEKLEEEPWIESARIEKRFFHTVVINITEREPVALLDCNGAGFLIDGTGVAIAGAHLDSNQSLPRISGGNISTPRPGAKVADGKVKECAVVLGGMGPGLRAALSHANPFDGRGQVFVAREGFLVIYGSREDTSIKNDLLEALMLDMRENGRAAEYIDIRVPDSPVIKFL